jgi:hypothetical protein
MSFKTFKPLIISFALSLTGSLLMNMLSYRIFAQFWYASLLFHSVISLLLILLLFRKAGDPKDYTFKIMFASMGRLLLCMICLLVYKVCDKDNFTQFALHFGLHYILFTVFEMASLLKFIKAPKS